ncbi:hypothetical protein [Nocardia amamiensis]
MDLQVRTDREETTLDPYVILGWVNTGLSVLSHGLSVAAQALALILPFI